MRHLIGLFMATLLCISSTFGWAFDIPLHDLRVGVRGGPNVNILPDVGEEDPTPVYPGFVDIGWFIGGSLAYDFRDFVGIEIEFLYSREVARGTVEYDRDVGTDRKKEESEFGLEATALHLPVLVRGQIPLGVARPFLHLGADFVLKRSDHAMSVTPRGDAPPYTDGCSPGIDCDPFPAFDYAVNPVDSSILLLVGFGLDIDVGAATIPVEIRALIKPGLGDSITDRTVTQTASPTYLYNNEWQYQVLVLFGANYVIF
ncbi:MAG: hypothetical protein JW797_12140 [Bradymonadales bacterium]|nr:hypothetical protein [Bradymonadales bacterium]